MKFNKIYYEPYKDIFGIYKELKQINYGYRLFFNKKNKKYEILNINKNYELCYVFNSISEINITKLRFFKIENYTTILKSIESDNQNLEIKSLSYKTETIKNTLSEFKKLNNRSSILTQKDLNKIIGVTQC